MTLTARLLDVTVKEVRDAGRIYCPLCGAKDFTDIRGWGSRFGAYGLTVKCDCGATVRIIVAPGGRYHLLAQRFEGRSLNRAI